MRVCTYCGLEFEPKKHNQIYCSDGCRNTVANIRNRMAYYNGKKIPNKELENKCKEIDDYNEAHGTRYTYGQYMAYVEGA